ncbi:hypothetical protein [Candidatus Liberibacter sp.]|uniref:hypothetical protein n=1 Tax=Candidatus Liberibacter sp. TaxID=34022 RepID=UPI0015F58CB8|nr:hypothetical protein [Candidatus Liberibacter sp.]MBA5724466.1 hypothetical protein [Candidatus Liberibacter sp.]
MKIAHVQNSFSGGIVSPHISRSRTDLESYRSSLVDCCNYIPTIEGALYRRPSATYLKDANIQDGKHRIVSSASHDGKSFVFEFGRKSLAVVEGGAETIELFPIIATPYSDSDLEDLNFTSNIGLSFKPSLAGVQGDKAGWCIVHPKHPPHLLGRTKNGWALNPMELTDGAYLGTRFIGNDTVKDTATMAVTIDEGKLQVVCSEDLFTQEDCQRPIRLGFKMDDGSGAQYLHWYWVTIRQVISARVAQVAFGNASALLAKRESILGKETSDWNLGAFSAHLGYPSHVTVFKDRLAFVKGNRIFFSKIGVHKTDFGFTTSSISGEQDVATSDSAYDVSICSEAPENIRWISSFRDVLVIGTDHSEWEFSEKGSNHRVLKQISSYGTNGIVLKVQKSLVFVQRSGRTLLHLSHSEREGYRISNLSAMVSPLLTVGIKEICYQQIPFSVIWVLMNDGSLFGVTFDEEQKISAWHRHTLGGEGAVLIENITAFPSASRRQCDVLCLLVNRPEEIITQTLAIIGEYPSSPKSEHFLDYGKDGIHYPYTSSVTLPHVGDALSDPAIAYSKRRIKAVFVEAEGADTLKCGVDDGVLTLASNTDERMFLVHSTTSRAGTVHLQQTKAEHGIITGVIMSIDISHGGI